MARSISRTVTGPRRFRCSIPARLLGSVGWPLGVIGATGTLAMPLSLCPAVLRKSRTESPISESR